MCCFWLWNTNVVLSYTINTTQFNKKLHCLINKSWSYGSHGQRNNLLGVPRWSHFLVVVAMLDLVFLDRFVHKNGDILCSLVRKSPEFFKTHPTFVFSPLQVPSIAHQTRITVFFGTPCISQIQRRLGGHNETILAGQGVTEFMWREIFTPGG